MKMINAHTHSNRSDGLYSPDELVKKAKECHIGILSITDHNTAFDLTDLRAQHPDILLIQGSEASCIWEHNGKKHEIHVLGFGFDVHHPDIQAIFDQNRAVDKWPYAEAILHKLKDCGINLGTYSSILRQTNKSFLSRMDISVQLVRQGYCSSVSEALDIYIGDRGKRLAHVPSGEMIHYVPLHQAVSAITAAGGLASIAHPLSFLLSEDELLHLIREFKEIAGPRAAIESAYAAYSQSQRNYIRENFAVPHQLIETPGSDFHGRDPSESLEQGLQSTNFKPLLEALNINDV